MLGPYGTFSFESGVHRVQRVSVNDTKLQTSVCLVAVLPLIREDSSNHEPLPLSDLHIETMRACAAGGQHINTTDSAVQITHVPDDKRARADLVSVTGRSIVVLLQPHCTKHQETSTLVP